MGYKILRSLVVRTVGVYVGPRAGRSPIGYQINWFNQIFMPPDIIDEGEIQEEARDFTHTINAQRVALLYSVLKKDFTKGALHEYIAGEPSQELLVLQHECPHILPAVMVDMAHYLLTHSGGSGITVETNPATLGVYAMPPDLHLSQKFEIVHADKNALSLLFPATLGELRSNALWHRYIKRDDPVSLFHRVFLVVLSRIALEINGKLPPELQFAFKGKDAEDWIAETAKKEMWKKAVADKLKEVIAEEMVDKEGMSNKMAERRAEVQVQGKGQEYQERKLEDINELRKKMSDEIPILLKHINEVIPLLLDIKDDSLNLEHIR